MRSRSSKGFTLIELLVVVGIIGILAAILFPVFVQARGQANRAGCLCNMKQIGVGLFAYMQDYDCNYPILRRKAPAPGVPQDRTWREEIAAYVKTTDCFRCPANPYGKQFPSVVAEPVAGGEYPISYAMNGSLFGSLSNDPTAFRVVKMRKVKEPSQSIYLIETRDASAELGIWSIGWVYPDGYGSRSGKGQFFHHNGRINVVMCDTSARSLKLMRTLTPTDLWHDPRILDVSPYVDALNTSPNQEYL
jgi:prepilin-type N-terminal cleavage/methylation domain-containing protein/prepilin-type processing-associated H-X9-DG protein